MSSIRGSRDGGGNGDTYLYRADLGLFAVAAPLGPSRRAARFFLTGIVDEFPEPLRRDDSEELRKTFTRTEMRWQEVVASEPESKGLGATVAAVVLLPGSLLAAHMGDCAIHLLRAGAIVKRSTDHVTHSMPTPKRREPARIITRAFGMNSNPEIWSWPCQSGDRVVLSAELGSVLSDAEIAAITTGAPTPRDATSALIAEATKRGAVDTVTALVLFLPTKRAG